MAKLKGKGTGSGTPPGGPRGKVTAFSHASRRRLLQTLAGIDRSNEALPLFVGLTYPGAAWSPNPADWHTHLEAFYKRLCRRYPGCRISIIWRMEPQKRGAPHFHLLIFGVPYLPYTWVGAVWSAIVGGDAVHAARCSSVQKVKSWRGVMSYASKYMGKASGGGAVFTDTDGQALMEVGRHWGVKGRQHLPVTWVRYKLLMRQFHRVRRVLLGAARASAREKARRTPGWKAPKRKVRGRNSGLWCFMLADEALRLVGAFAPDAAMVYETPKL
jgi:hypothetical protein